MDSIISIISINDDHCDKDVKTIQLVNNAWYLHGKLELMMNYDVAACYEIKDIEKNTKKVEKNRMEFMQLNINGIYPVKVYGVEEECLGYFWTDETNYNGMQRGLVVLKDDVTGNEYAKEKYNEKPIII